MKGIYKFEIFPRRTLRGRRFFFRMVAPNGEIIMQSQGYKTHRACLGTVTLIQSKAGWSPAVNVDG